MTEMWLPTLKTDSPQAGYELAVKLSRASVKMTQPDTTMRETLRRDYETDANALIAVSAGVIVKSGVQALLMRRLDPGLMA